MVLLKNYTWIWPRKLTELHTSPKHNKTLFHISQPCNIPFNGYYCHTLVHILKWLNHSSLGIHLLLHYHKSSYTFHTVILLTVHSTMCPVLELSLMTYLKKKKSSYLHLAVYCHERSLTKYNYRWQGQASHLCCLLYAWLPCCKM